MKVGGKMEKVAMPVWKFVLNQMYDVMWNKAFIFPPSGITSLGHDVDFENATVVLALGVRQSMPFIAKHEDAM